VALQSRFRLRGVTICTPPTQASSTAVGQKHSSLAQSSADVTMAALEASQYHDLPSIDTNRGARSFGTAIRSPSARSQLGLWRCKRAFSYYARRIAFHRLMPAALLSAGTMIRSLHARAQLGLWRCSRTFSSSVRRLNTPSAHVSGTAGRHRDLLDIGLAQLGLWCFSRALVLTAR
jgi:hypothetical protein